MSVLSTRTTHFDARRNQWERHTATNAMRDDGRVKIRITALPVEEDEMHGYLTHFQHDKNADARVKTVRVYCKPTDTIQTVKKLAQEELGEKVEMLKRGGAPGGIELDDAATLAELGYGERDMSVWEYFWVDSEARMARMAADREKMLSLINIKTNDLTPKVVRMLKDCTLSR